MDAREHWQGVYERKTLTELSWYQADASLSLSLIRHATPERSAAIIDVGGGASTLVDGLLSERYSNVTVLDVSGKALAQARDRLGEEAAGVTWVEGNILDVTRSLSRGTRSGTTVRSSTSSPRPRIVSGMFNKYVAAFVWVVTSSWPGLRPTVRLAVAA